jgi:Ser/Thr protein kinase RdoA (MazF antagonist)
MLQDGRDNTVFLVETTRGLCVGRFSKRDHVRHVSFEHAVLQMFHKKAAPVPVVQLTRWGATFLQSRFGVFSLFSYLPGCRLETMTVEGARAAGRLLWEIHDVARGWTWTESPPRDAWTELRRVAENAALIQQRWSDGRELVLASEEAMSATLDGSADLELLACHGDYRPDNVLFRSGKAAGVIDWDWCSYAPPVSDVALGMIEWSFPDTARSLDRRMFVEFARGYGFAHLESSSAELLSWVLMGCISSAATLFCDALVTDLGIGAVCQSHMFRKYVHVRQNFEELRDVLDSSSATQ